MVCQFTRCESVSKKLHRKEVIAKMEFDYTVETNKSFEAAVSAVEAETASAGFKVLHIHDVRKTLSEKGFEIDDFKTVEICNAKAAYTVLKADIKIGLMLPCKINVYVKDGKTILSGLRPIVLFQFFPKANLGTLPKDIDKVIRSVIDKAAK